MTRQQEAHTTKKEAGEPSHILSPVWGVSGWWEFCQQATHSRLNTGERSSEESALPTGSIRSILLSYLLRSASSSS